MTLLRLCNISVLRHYNELMWVGLRYNGGWRDKSSLSTKIRVEIMNVRVDL